MTKITLDQIKKLRTKTKAGVMDCRKALKESADDMAKAEKWLLKKGLTSAAKRADKETKAGLVGAYTHHHGGLASLVAVACETDFVARTKEFRQLVHDLAMQVAANKTKKVSELLKQPWIKDEKKTVGDLVKQVRAKTGENVVVKGCYFLDLKE